MMKPQKNRFAVKQLKRYWPLYLMLLPGSVYLMINNYIPMAGVTIAFKQYNFRSGLFGGKFVGLKNFEFLFKTSDAWIITRNTICYNVVFIVLGTALAITIAIILASIQSGFLKQIYQTAILAPYLISMVVVSYLVFAFLSESNGFLNKGVLHILGIAPISWYSQAKYWPFILVFVEMWKTIGYNCILYYATIVSIDRSYYEAAVVDGADYWQQVVHITLPCLKTTIIILTLMSIGGIFYSDFGLFYQVPMNQGTLIDATNTIDTYVFRGLIESNNVSMSSAAGLYQSFVGFILVMAANFTVKKVSKDSALF